jgi:hypothetical protein
MVEAVLENEVELMSEQLRLNVTRDNINLQIDWNLEGEKRSMLQVRSVLNPEN